MKNLEYFIWDFDGTLFNTYPAIVLTLVNLIKKIYNKDLNFKNVKELCQDSLYSCFNQISKELKIDREKLQQEFAREYSNTKESEEPPFSGAIEILKFIRNKGGKNFIVTHRGKKNLYKLLKYYKMRHLFEDIITHEHGYPKKPNPTSFLYLIEKYKIPRENLLSIGDRDIDIQAARKININSCYFNPNGKINHLADLNIKSLFELKKKINP